MSMRLERLRWLDGLLGLVSTLALAFCLFYTYAGTFLIPYSGINYDADWIVTSLDACDLQQEWCRANQNQIQIGDQLTAIGPLTHEAHEDNQLLVPFDGYTAGASVPITRHRGGVTQATTWRMPTISTATLASRLSVMLIFLPFWLAGTTVLLFLRPRDLRWRLLVAFNYITAIWWVVGAQSTYYVAASALLLNATTWILTPIYLHLHLTLPAPILSRLTRYLMRPMYVIAAILAMLELFQLLPPSAYNVGLLLAVLGSLSLLVFHVFDKSSQAARLATQLMLTGIMLALGPGIVLYVIPALVNATPPEGVTATISIMAVPLLPLFYTYAIYKRHLGSLEFRANRLLSLYSFTLLYITLFALILIVGTRWIAASSTYVAFTLAIGTVFVVAAPSLRTRFQRWVDRLAYGTVYNPDEIIRVFANRIPIASDRQALVRLLADELVPSLLIRQSALYLMSEVEPHLVYVRNVNLVEVPDKSTQAQWLLAKSGQYLAPQPEPAGPPAPAGKLELLESAHPAAAESVANGEAYNWVRLAIPLKVQNRNIGVWLFGRRDPDDFYPQHDIALLSALANQVALAVQNAQLFDEAQRRLQRLEALRNIDLAITSSLDLRLTLNVFLDQVTNLLGMHAASILLYNPQSRMLEYAGQRGFRTGALRHTHLRMGEGFAGRAALDRQIVTVANLSASAGDLVRAKLLPHEGFIAYRAVPLIAKGDIKGVLEVFHRAPLSPDPEWLGFLDSLATQAAIAIDNATLFDGLQRSNAELALAYDTTLEGWSRALELRDQETEGHTRRVTEMTVRLAQRVGISDAEIVHMRRGALLHDIGKMAVPDSILLKPGPLTEAEWVIMCKHPTYAHEMLSPIAYLRPALDIPYCHHEKWDGTGYPRRLKGDQIPLTARIFAIADVWDALTSDRPYRAAWSETKAYDYIREQVGRHFDPQMAQVFLEMNQPRT
jgi:HD-GYP domain-containing protein (c-di-GMP phosphodiesterase class II)